MNGEQIRVAASVQGKRLDLPVGYHLAEMGRHGVDLGLNGFLGFGDRDRLGPLTDLQDGVDAQRGIGVDAQMSLLLAPEAGRFYGQNVYTHGEGREGIEALPIGACP